MERLCMRPGCDRPAVARLSYDPIACQVWLDPVLEWPGPAQEICELHSSRLTVPRGWMLCDRRDDEPSLFVPDVPTADAQPDSGSTGAPAATEQPAEAANGATRPTNGSSAPAPSRPAVPHPSARRGASSTRTAAARTAEARAAVVRRAVRPPTGRRTRPVAPPAPELFDPVVEPDDGGARVSAPATLESEPRPRRTARRVAQTAPIPGSSSSGEVEAPAPRGDAPVAPVEDLDVRIAVEIDIEARPAVADEPALPDEPTSDDATTGDAAADDAASDEPTLSEPTGDADPDPDGDALPESLQATSPLLSRAFRATGPQRSVLSQTLLNDAD